MNAFHSRITPIEAQTIWRCASEQGFLTADSQSLIVHELGNLKNRIARLKQAFPNTALHAIAIKANPLVEILKFCVQNGCGLEAGQYRRSPSSDRGRR